MQDETTAARAADAVCSLADVEAAAARLAGHAIRTPLLTNAWLDEITGARVLIKPETLQHIGAFKFRGAYNRLVQIPEADRPRGVVAWSSGNHAQGVAAAARMLGMPATIVMPADTPALKLANTRALGATVRIYDRYSQSREEIGAGIARETGATIVPPYDDRDVIAGQGTLGLEIAEQARDTGAPPDIVLVCCGGGGLVAGVSTAIKGRLPRADVYCVEPEGFDDTARSLKAGTRLGNDPAARSICDAIVTPMPGELTFAVNRVRLAGGLVVSDDEVLAAMAYAMERLKLVVEPGGCVALAALLWGRIDVAGKTVAVVLSGGNADTELLMRALRRGTSGIPSLSR
jgi:threonine dehydratase